MKHTALLLFLAVSMVAGQTVADDDLTMRGVIETPNRWDGFYVGLFGGISASDATIDGTIYNDGPPPQHNQLLLDGINAINDFALAGTSASYGVQAGVNAQLDSLVLGMGVDFGRPGVAGSAEGSGTALGVDFEVEDSFVANWMLALKPRVGVLATDNLLLYATGGVALTNVTFEHSYLSTFGNASSAENVSVTDTLLGWVAGIGIEYAVDENWSVGAEYTYTDIGGMSETGRVESSRNGTLNTVFQNDLDLTVQALRLSANYRF